MVVHHVASAAPGNLRSAFGLSRERMARLVDVSAKTIERWEASASPPAGRVARQRWTVLQQIASVGLLVYTPAGFQAFLTTPLPTLEGRTPLQTIEAGREREVFAALVADYEGLGS